MSDATPTLGIGSGPRSAWATLVRGLQLSPELREGLWVTMLLAVVATTGKVAVPVAVQQTIDVGVVGSDQPRLGLVSAAVGGAALVLVVTSLAGYAMTYRLARASETALSAVRVAAFRRIHDLSVLHQAAEHRGALVARVTSDVDQISRFIQWGGVILIVRGGQALLALAAMALYSWQLTLVVLAIVGPMAPLISWFQGRLSAAFDLVRERHAAMMTAVSESVVGAATVRAYGIEDRTEQRISDRVGDEFRAQFRAGRLAATMFSSAEVIAGLATAAVVVVGVPLGVAGALAAPGEPWVGRLAAFLFLATLFVGPLRIATEVLEQAQTAISGWRRVLGVLDTEPDVADPPVGTTIPAEPIGVRFERVRFRYPTGGDVLPGLDLEIAPQSRVAVVGETGSGKTTFSKLLTRLMDPTEGIVRLNGVPLTEVAFEDLRRRVVMVPQDGFLFDGSIADNVRYGRPGCADDRIRLAFLELGLGEWLDGLSDGERTAVGERGERLSVGERQLVALARAYVADPDLLVLDEATSAVDPATEVRIQRALDSVTRGRTAIAIAHRLSTAEAADEILVFHDGEVVQRGPHDVLAQQEGVYADLHANWMAGTRSATGGRRAQQRSATLNERWAFPYPSQRMPVLAEHVVATSQPLAAQAGLEMMRRGGNAVDAAIATAAALTVLEPTSNGLGSDAFALVWDGERLHGLNASGRAPAGLDPERFVGRGPMPARGWDAVTVPGAVSAWKALSERFGRLGLDALVEPAARYAEQGWRVGPITAAAWTRAERSLADVDGFAEAFLPGGRAPRPGQRFAFPDQARSLRAIGASGGEAFYTGELAERFVAAARAAGAPFQARDLAGHRADWVEPLTASAFGLEVAELPPNGQGIAALAALGILEGSPVGDLGPDEPESLHYQIEAMKAAFADTHAEVADPDAMQVGPGALLSRDRLATHRTRIDPATATHDATAAPARGGTVYLAAADGEGTMVSFIQSNYMGFGSGVVVPGTGIALQNRGAGFSTEPAHPNVVGPGKRPFHTIIPAFAHRDGVPHLAFGVMGGHMQPQGHVQMVLRVGLHGQNPQAAADAPRWRFDEGRTVALEAGFRPAVLADLARRGHEVVQAEPGLSDAMFGFGGAQLVERLDDGVWLAASDPRKEGAAVGF